MAPGWNNSSGGDSYMYKPSQDPAASGELYALLERVKKTLEVKGQMRDTQALITEVTKNVDQSGARWADGFDGTLPQR
ncbi:hypothetical protein PG997_000151 [Apiospora hydei]|uniref:Uncharacterized protein n=1 Tax=Apiospora hydei TaxID=1337664 RepID=A0ABR1X9Z1_9PEZI